MHSGVLCRIVYQSREKNKKKIWHTTNIFINKRGLNTMVEAHRDVSLQAQTLNNAKMFLKHAAGQCVESKSFHIDVVTRKLQLSPHFI